nr:hypothetical protein CFP56_32236 [Quercus suber]
MWCHSNDATADFCCMFVAEADPETRRVGEMSRTLKLWAPVWRRRRPPLQPSTALTICLRGDGPLPASASVQGPELPGSESVIGELVERRRHVPALDSSFQLIGHLGSLGWWCPGVHSPPTRLGKALPIIRRAAGAVPGPPVDRQPLRLLFSFVEMPWTSVRNPISTRRCTLWPVRGPSMVCQPTPMAHHFTIHEGPASTESAQRNGGTSLVPLLRHSDAVRPLDGHRHHVGARQWVDPDAVAVAVQIILAMRSHRIDLHPEHPPAALRRGEQVETAVQLVLQRVSQITFINAGGFGPRRGKSNPNVSEYLAAASGSDYRRREAMETYGSKAPPMLCTGQVKCSAGPCQTWIAEHSGSHCSPLSWASYAVVRPQCDRCIIHGEILSQNRGLDRGVYCQRMGVEYQDLYEANPGAFTICLLIRPHGETVVRTTAGSGVESLPSHYFGPRPQTSSTVKEALLQKCERMSWACRLLSQDSFPATATVASFEDSPTCPPVYKRILARSLDDIAGRTMPPWPSTPSACSSLRNSLLLAITGSGFR